MDCRPRRQRARGRCDRGDRIMPARSIHSDKGLLQSAAFFAELALAAGCILLLYYALQALLPQI